MLARRLVVAGFAAGFCLAGWLFDRLNRALADGQETVRREVDDLLFGPDEPAPWLPLPQEAP